MNGSDKRRHIRVESTNLLNFVCMGVDGEPCHQGMGRTLNVSESGILLETYKPIDSQTPISITIGIEEELIDIEGEVVFLKESARDVYEAGIKFSQISAKERMILLKFIEVFKKKLD
jgi:c-di-GMP-binding flagellar brake protein YcgR